MGRNNKFCAFSQKQVADGHNCDNIPTIPKRNINALHAMNTSSKDNSSLEIVAVVSCVLSTVWFFAANVMA